MKKFIFICLWCIVLSASVSSAQSLNNSTANDTVLHAVGYAHLDTQWRWDYQKTINDYIPSTMYKNFELFEKYPHYIFNFTGANRYRMMKEYYPEAYERVKKYVAAGRWHPNGSSIEENDVLSPSPESVFRQILYGNEFFRKEFGMESYDYMIPDCFGFPASLPTVLAHAGIKGFSTQKLSWGSAMGIPFNIGLWVGPDNQSVVSVLNPGKYDTKIKEDLTNSKKWVDRIMEQGKKTGLYKEYMYYGTGDIGGSPTDESVSWLEKSIASKGGETQGIASVHVISAPADKFFMEITPEQKQRMPSYKGELLLINHSAGSLTSAAFMKKCNRKNELFAYSAEASSVIADWLGGMPYPKSKINEAWRLILGAQFHDMLPGTCIPRAYEFCWNDEILASNQFGNVLTGAVGTIARTMNTNTEGIPVIVYNPLAFSREDVVEATISNEQLTMNNEQLKYVKVYDKDGKEVPSQILEIKNKKLRILFTAKVPSVGFATFDIRKSDEPCKINTGLEIRENSLENSRYLVKINSNGDISEIFDKLEKQEILSAPATLAFMYEKPEKWPAWNMDWNDRKKAPAGFVDGKPNIKIIESGPSRIALQVEREARGSKFVQQIRLSADGAADIVEVKNNIDWFTKESSLKATFPLTVSNSIATYNGEIGTVQRGNNDSVKFEVPSHQWFDLTDKEGKYGVSVLEDCKNGSDKPNDNTLRLTMLYTPGVRNSYMDQGVQDFGKHEILYALYGHKGDWREGNSYMMAARVNQPLAVFETIKHDGYLGKSFSFLNINNPNITVLAFKKAENSEEIILRVCENKGNFAKDVVISLFSPIISAREVNGQEQPLSSANVKDGKLVFDITPYNPRTFALTIQKSKVKSQKIECQSVELKYNIDGISYDNNKSDGDFDNEGRTYPAEMLPDTITSEGVIFKMGPKADGEKNVLSCKGQTISLPKLSSQFSVLSSQYIYILAASSSDDVAGTFKVDGKPYTMQIQKWTGFIGQWDKRIWDGRVNKVDFVWANIPYAGLTPGFVKNTNVAFHVTHRHLKTGENDPYIYCYLFKYKIPVTANAKELTLPNDEKIKIFAVTLANNENDNVIPAGKLYDTLNISRDEYARFQVIHPRPKIYPEYNIFKEGEQLKVSMTSEELGEEIRYTLDESEPTANSAFYSKPIELKNPVTVKAAIFKDKKKITNTAEESFYRCIPVKKIDIKTEITKDYSNEPNTLIDLKRASSDMADDYKFVGFESNDMEVVLDLGETKTISNIIIGFLNAQDWLVFLPESIEISVSDNQNSFREIKVENYGIPQKKDDYECLKDFDIKLGDVQARYIKVKARNTGKCPEWHKKKGEKVTMLIDEIMVE